MLIIVETLLIPYALLKTADFDTSPKKRRETPEFYGFVPPTGRGLIFLLMVVNATAHFFAKILAIALLGAVSKTWTLGYIVGDIVLYLIYTLVRNDFIHYILAPNYIMSIVLSLMARIIFKVRGGGIRVDEYHFFQPILNEKHNK